MRRTKLVIGGSALALALGAAGGSVAFAGGNDDQTLVGAPADQARAAALQYTGGGHAGIVEPESSDPEEGGAAYGVEVTKPDGSPVDVFLDQDYKLMRIASNADG
jgi:hypothetical protein